MIHMNIPEIVDKLGPGCFFLEFHPLTAMTSLSTFPMCAKLHCTTSWRSLVSCCPENEAHPEDLPTPRLLYRIT